MKTNTLRRPAEHSVTFRRMRFPFEDGFPRDYFGGSAFKSRFFAALSTAFEPGEAFFIDSARAMREHIDDPALTEELKVFCQQEGHHTAQHVKFNRMVADHGLNMARCQRRYTRGLDRARRRADAPTQLAITCALEHFTSAGAHVLLSQPRHLESMDPGVRALWQWHAVEEIEHKATCHDIYATACPGYFRRVTTMIGAWFGILAIALINTADMLHADGKLFAWKDNLAGLYKVFGPGGLVPSLVPAFLSYLRPSFHPWDVDDTDLLAEWAAQNQQYVIQPAA